MGRKKTTGNYETREELISEIKSLVGLGLPWRIIARRTGVSETTAANLLYHPEGKRPS